MGVERTGNAVGFHHEHRNAVKFGPHAPVGGDVREIVRYQKRHRQARIGVVKFERHRHGTIAMVDGAGGDAGKCPGGQSDRERQAAFGQVFLHHRTALVQGDIHLCRIVAPRIGNPLRKMRRIQPQFVSGPIGLDVCIRHL